MSRDYFAALYGASRDFVEQLELPSTAQPLAELMGELRPRIEGRRSETVGRLWQLRQHAEGETAEVTLRKAKGVPIGLNTVGFLCDRLTVLAMKEWVLLERLGSPVRARELRDTQIRELLDALAGARPGYSSFTQKISALEAEADAHTWEEAYVGLLSVNILLWEAQEVLYAGRIEKLECSELRRYIAWFSEGNIRRNNYIAKCETLFWSDLRKEHRLAVPP